MYEYEVLVEDINPCGGEQYARKEILEIETDNPEAWVKAHSRHPNILENGTNAKGDTVIITGDGHGYIIRYTFTE